MKKKNLLISILLLPFMFVMTSVYAHGYYAPKIDQQQILANAPKLNPQALKYAVMGYEWALEHHEVNNPNVLTVIDFSLPSNARRVWVIDLKSSKVLMNIFTTQGKNSGSFYATHFSNDPRTDETSLGVYKTLNVYYGKHGLSERLQGLEPGINNNALSRDIVVHPAWYASSNFIETYNYAGCSWGCFGIDQAVSKEFIDITKNGSIIFAYANPEKGDRYIRNA